MTKIGTFILIIALALISACFDDSNSNSNCYIPTELPSNTYEVMGAGSNKYNGIYTKDYETEVNGEIVFVHEDNSLYTIEYDTSDAWCIKDNGVLQYCMEPYVYDNFNNHDHTYNFSVVYNGTSPGPSFEKISLPWFLKCGEL